MTIDEAIEIFKEIKYPTNGDNEYEREKAKQIMIKTVRKYQKIQKIVSDFREYKKGACGFGGATYMQMVSEVVEDGN